MKEYKYLIIGGGMAGGKACEGIRDVDDTGSIGLITMEDHPPYQKPPLSKGYLLGKQELENVYLNQVENYQELGVDLVLGKKATQLNIDEHQIILDDSGVIKYEKLLLATGASALKLPIWGAELENVFTLRSIEDSQNIRKAAGENTRALVMGGSFIGSEVAASISQLGTQVVQIFPESRLLEFIAPPELSQHLERKFEDNNVRILPGTISEGLEGETSVQRAILNNGEKLDIDFVVMGVGIRLNTDLATEAGLEAAADGSLIVNSQLQTSHPDIYAAGDIVSWPDPHGKERQHVEHWDVARRQGRLAGKNIAGEEIQYTALPYFFSDLYDFSFEVWGEIANWDSTVQRGKIEDGSFAYYYFQNNRLRGVLAVGRPDAERDAMKTLPQQRPTYHDTADKLKDESFDINQLINES